MKLENISNRDLCIVDGQEYFLAEKTEGVTSLVGVTQPHNALTFTDQEF